MTRFVHRIKYVIDYIKGRMRYDIVLFLIILTPLVLLAWAAGIFDDNRKVKILRYHTVVLNFDVLPSTATGGLSYVNIYVLPADSCYYIYEVNSFNDESYSRMNWRKVKELPSYLSRPKDLWVKSIMVGEVKELEYTLVPAWILPDSIRKNLKEQREQEYPMPEKNDFDEGQQQYDSDGNRM
jgi:hypothetical protein